MLHIHNGDGSADSAMLAEQVDAVELNGLDLWLGAVHLQGFNPGWRWDGEKLVATS